MVLFPRIFLAIVAGWLIFVVMPLNAISAEIAPFYTQNQSPIMQIFGLPPADRAVLLPTGRSSITLVTDIANNFTTHQTNSENIHLDGESYRLNLIFRHGISSKIEAGLDIPWQGYGGGIFDSFIEGWHDFFNLPQGGRKQAAKNQLLYSYTRDGEDRLKIDDSNFGLGDMRLQGGLQLFHDGKPNPRAVALRCSLKLPTGDSDKLHGSGSTDLSLWFTASDDYLLSDNWGNFTLFGAAGGMILSKGNVLRDQQRNLVGFGTIGCGWSPADWISFKMELPFHSSFYKGSQLNELNSSTIMFLIGGTLYFPRHTSLDIGVSEDLAVSTSPDVALHLALTHRF